MSQPQQTPESTNQADRLGHRSAPSAGSAWTARETAIKEIRRLCDEALAYDIGWPSFRAMLAHRLKIEQAFIDMATTPND